MPRDQTLVSFLGRYEKYSRKPYAFADGDVIEASFFGWAAWQHFRAQPHAPASWVILGTATSSWECLIDLFGDEIPDGLIGWSDRVEAERRDVGTTDARLAEFTAFASTLAIPEVVLRIVSVGNLDEIFAVLHETVPPATSVMLDVTHAPRAMPMNALLALGGLRWMRDIQLADVLYGNIVVNDGQTDEPTPGEVVSLLSAAELAAHGPALARIAITDDFEAAAEVGRSMGAISQQEDQLLVRQGIYQSLLCRRQAAENARHLRKRFADETVAESSGGLRNALRGWIRQKLEHVSREKGGKNVGWLLTDARKSLDRRDYLRCLFQLNEAVRLELADQLGLKMTASFKEVLQGLAPKAPPPAVLERFRVLMQLRNRAAHGAAGGTSKLLRPYLQDPATIRQLFKLVVADLERVLAGAKFWEL